MRRNAKSRFFFRSRGSIDYPLSIFWILFDNFNHFFPLGMYHVPHGVANVVTFAPRMDYISMANIPKFVQLARAMGKPPEGISPPGSGSAGDRGHA
jgi:alcohol dehydrogenase class IV